MGLATPPIDVAIRLADEGVPLRAIARAVNIPSEAVRDHLSQAKHDGRLVDLPREDWPPGCPRDERALQLSRMVRENRETVAYTISKLFSLTTIETRLLLALVHWQVISRERAGLPEGSMDVHIHHLRSKLDPYHVVIETVWGRGYRLSPDNHK